MITPGKRRTSLKKPDSAAILRASAEPQPLYQAIKSFVVNNIEGGVWEPGMRIPSEAEIAEIMAASRMTVNRAIRELTAEGRVTRIQGVGTFVAKPRPPATLLSIRSIGDEIAERGGIHSCHVITQTSEAASDSIADSLGLASAANVYHIVIVHLENDLPVQIEDRHVNPTAAPDFLFQDFTKMTPSHYLLGLLPVTEIEHRIESKLLDRRESVLLQIPMREAALVLNRRSWSGRQVVTCVRMISPGLIYSVGGRFRVDGTHQN